MENGRKTKFFPPCCIRNFPIIHVFSILLICFFWNEKRKPVCRNVGVVISIEFQLTIENKS